jgi:TPR repeat protein
MPAIDMQNFKNQIVFFGFCPGADFTRRLDTRWKELGICEFQYFESKIQVKRFASIEIGDLIVLKKRQVIGKTMRVYGYGLVTGITKDDKGNRVLKVDWSSQEQVIEVPLLGCNATIDIRDIDKVRADMPDAFFEWLNQGAEISGSSKPESKTEATALEEYELDEDSSEQELLDAAYWDDVEAMEYLGSGYANGKWGEEDSANSFKWYMKAAEHGSEIGMFNAASYLVQGDVVEQNMELALLFLNKLAVGSDYSADANYNLGIIYENGIGNTPKDVTKAKEYYLKAKNLGSNEAVEALKGLPENNVSVQDADQEYNDLLKAAEAGDDQAQVKLSMYCSKRAESSNESEAEVKKWAERAVDWMTKAAAQKNTFALKSMADLYEQVGDYKNSMSCLEIAAKQNDAIAIYNLGVHYEKGLGCSQDLEKAFELTKKAADLGMPKAMRIVGYNYDVGEGVEKDEKIAFSWYHKAAEAGDARAQFNLAIMYATAAGTELNFEQAQSWAIKAMENPDSAEPDIPEQARSFLDDIEKIIAKKNKRNTEPNDSNRSLSDDADRVLDAKSRAIKIFNKTECEYEYIGDFKNGIAKVRKNGLWGLLATDGTLIVKPEHRFENDTSNNEIFGDEVKIEWTGFQGFDIAPFSDNGKLSFLNQKGFVVTRTDYAYDTINTKLWRESHAHHSNDSSLLAFTAEGKIGFITNDGKIAIPPKYTYVEEEDGTLYGFGCGLARVNQNGLWGFINKADEFIIEPKFTNVGYFYDDPDEPTKAQIDGKMGFINTQGDVVIPAEYHWDEYLGLFVGGQAYVKLSATHPTQVINCKGVVLITPPMPVTNLKDLRFREPNYIFKYGGKHGLINSCNEVIAPAHYDWIGNTIKHVNLICMKRGDMYGLIDINGARILDPVSDSEIKFKTSSGKLVQFAIIANNREKSTYIIDQKGNKLEQLSDGCGIYDVLENHLIIVSKDEDSYDLYRHTDGKITFVTSYEEVKPLFDDYYVVKKDDLRGIVDKSLNEILSCQFAWIDQLGQSSLTSELVMFGDESGIFHGLFDIKKRDAIVRFDVYTRSYFNGIQNSPFMKPISIHLKGKTYNSVQCRSGDVAIATSYEKIDDYHDGMAAFTDSGKVGFINTFGNVQIKPTFLNSEYFSDGVCPVQDEMGWFLIDKAGGQLFSHRFELISSSDKKIFGAKFNEKWGVIDANGQWLIDPIHDSCPWVGENVIKLEKNKHWGIVSFEDSSELGGSIPRNITVSKKNNHSHAKSFKVKLPRKYMFDVITYENPWLINQNITDRPMWRSGYLIVSADSEETVVSEFQKMKKYVDLGIDGVVIESSVDMTVEKIYFYDLQPYSNGSDYYFDFEISDMPEDYRIAYERGQEFGSGTRYLFESWKVISHLSIYTGDIDDIECIELRSAA